MDDDGNGNGIGCGDRDLWMVYDDDDAQSDTKWQINFVSL